MNYKFKIGDRVKNVSSEDNESKFGQVGTVLENDTIPWVAFDEPTGFGGDGNSIPGWKPGHMDCLKQSELELVQGEPAKPEWNGVFRVGDKGKTRGGIDYTVTHIDDMCTTYPVAAYIKDNGTEWYTMNGQWQVDGDGPEYDLLPPTERGPVVCAVDAVAPAPAVKDRITVATDDGDVELNDTEVVVLMQRVAELEAENARLKDPSSSEAQQARAWTAVWNALWKVFPYSESGDGSGQEKALEAIRKLGGAWRDRNGRVVELAPGEEATPTPDTFVQFPGGRELRTSDADFPAMVVVLDDVVRSWEESGGAMFADMLLLRDAYRDWAKN